MFKWLFGPTRTQQILANIRARGPLTELMPWDGRVPTNLQDGKPLADIVARPVYGHWETITKGLWPRPDPSKRWRLFIQEDTRP